MTPIQVVGVGLDAASLSPQNQARLLAADVLVGGPRQLAAFRHLQAEFWELQPLPAIIERLQQRLQSPNPGNIVVLASGDPLFFGIGRLLLAALPTEALSFFPHPSSVQLAFSRLNLPWQEAQIISLHGRSPDLLAATLRQGADLVALLSDPHHSPQAIAQAVLDLDLPQSYPAWVCVNLGGPTETIHHLELKDIAARAFEPLNVVVLKRREPPSLTDSLPCIGLPDNLFHSFRDRPGLITKREVRVQILGELNLQPGQVVWDIGAGTGSVSIETARLIPDAHVYAIEKTAAGFSLIQQNCSRFQVSNVKAIRGSAPAVLATLPDPDRIFIGGSSGQLDAILTACAQRLRPDGRIVLALTTLEHPQQVLQWIPNQPPARNWNLRQLQVQIARSVAIASLTRWAPLNPVTLMTLWPR